MGQAYPKVIFDAALITREELNVLIVDINKLWTECFGSLGKRLVFKVKEGTDDTILWKSTIEVLCQQQNEDRIENCRSLDLFEFLNVAKNFKYQLSAVSDCASSSATNDLSASVVFNKLDKFKYPSCDESKHTECCICLDRELQLTLPCAHAFCAPCIEQWNVENRTCPICRETFNITDDSWVMSEAPERQEVDAELKNLLSFSVDPDKQ